MPGPTEIREAISALETRRAELEALIADDLERRLFLDVDEVSEVVTNSVAPPVNATDFRTVNTRCGSHFTMTWFAVSTS